MDLLQRAVSPSIITSLVVNDAEQVDSVLNDEAWITTMIRKENKVIIEKGKDFSRYFYRI